jgi:hypothetical protein
VSGDLRRETDATVLVRHLTDLYTTLLSLWANDEISSLILKDRIHFGIAVSLAGVATPKAAKRLTARALQAQSNLARS